MTTEKPIDSWIAALEPTLRSVADGLRRVILDSCPDLVESIKWGNPAYEKGGLVCYLAATKAYVSLGFFNGAALTDSEGIIEGTGKKMRHVKVRNLGDIPDAQFSSWVQEAVELNRGR